MNPQMTRPLGCRVEDDGSLTLLHGGDPLLCGLDVTAAEGLAGHITALTGWRAGGQDGCITADDAAESVRSLDGLLQALHMGLLASSAPAQVVDKVERIIERNGALFDALSATVEADTPLPWLPAHLVLHVLVRGAQEWAELLPPTELPDADGRMALPVALPEGAVQVGIAVVRERTAERRGPLTRREREAVQAVRSALDDLDQAPTGAALVGGLCVLLGRVPDVAKVLAARLRPEAAEGDGGNEQAP